MILKVVKKICIVVGTALLIPIVIGLFIGGGYILFSSVNGSTLDESLKNLPRFTQTIQPLFNYLILLFLIPLLIKGIKKGKLSKG
ncbi:hypothetical protein [Metabacillus sp. SLBN-84]